MLTINQHNPDVLSCLANLSSDEVFTPPSVVNDVLDLLPEEIWKNPRNGVRLALRARRTPLFAQFFLGRGVICFCVCYTILYVFVVNIADV